MASSSLLQNKQFNKLKVNRLDAQQIKSDNILPDTPSYLFSAIFNNATFVRTNTGGTLTVTANDTESIIQFSDRPFRQTSNISFDAFVSLFKVSTGDNTFNEDPPNGVLTHSEEQRTYKITLLNSDLGSATFNLDLLPDETHNLNTVTGRMNLFVDPGTLGGFQTATQRLYGTDMINFTKKFFAEYLPNDLNPDTIKLNTIKLNDILTKYINRSTLKTLNEISNTQITGLHKLINEYFNRAIEAQSIPQSNTDLLIEHLKSFIFTNSNNNYVPLNTNNIRNQPINY